MTPQPAVGPPEGWADQYEAIRAQALGQRPKLQPLGLMLFLQRGMSAWMEAWRRLVPSPGMPKNEARPANGDLPHHPDLPVLLANLALRALEGASS